MALFATESALITNTDNRKVFDATGDAMLINDFNDDRSQAATRSKGVTAHLGEYTLPGEDKKQTGIILVKGEVEATHTICSLPTTGSSSRNSPALQ